MKNKPAELTMRDYFAAKAMQGTMANYQWMQDLAEAHSEIPGPVLVAMSAYDLADAMMEARSKK